MRTKNLNLKKKIAFIASVAMIATTASYLPAGIVNNITADAYVASNEYEAGAGVIAEDVDVVDTFDTFVTVNGKYVCLNKSTQEYVLQNTLDLTNTTIVPIEVSNYFVSTTDVNKDPYHENTDKAFYAEINGGQTNEQNNAAGGVKGGTGNVTLGTTDNYNVLVPQLTDKDNGNALEIPYFADAKEVKLVFAAKKGAKLSERSITEISVNLNDNGEGRIGTLKE